MLEDGRTANTKHIGAVPTLPQTSSHVMHNHKRACAHLQSLADCKGAMEMHLAPSPCALSQAPG